MNERREGPILESRYHEGLQSKRKNPIVFIVVGLFLIMGFGAFFFVVESDNTEQQFVTEVEAPITELETQKLKTTETPLVKKATEKEEGTTDFFYKRALERDNQKDYEGAVKDYTRAIELAKKYSVEMWESLNNRGVIRAEQFQNYEGAIKDFDKIIEIEFDRIDGEIDDIKLETAYSNRAYVKMAKGNKSAACDDLYEALSYADENSITFLEKKIASVCE